MSSSTTAARATAPTRAATATPTPWLQERTPVIFGLWSDAGASPLRERRAQFSHQRLIADLPGDRQRGLEMGRGLAVFPACARRASQVGEHLRLGGPVAG